MLVNYWQPVTHTENIDDNNDDDHDHDDVGDDDKDKPEMPRGKKLSRPQTSKLSLPLFFERNPGILSKHFKAQSVLKVFKIIAQMKSKKSQTQYLEQMF